MTAQQRSVRSLCHGRYARSKSPSDRLLIPDAVCLQAYQRAGHVTQDELALIKKVDRQSRAKVESLLQADGQSYALLYLRLLKKLQRVDTQQLLLVLIADALSGAPFPCLFTLPS